MPTATVDRQDPAHAGQAVYTRGFLTVYDAVVYGFNSPVLWRCPKAGCSSTTTPNVSARHLDLGVESIAVALASLPSGQPAAAAAAGLASESVLPPGEPGRSAGEEGGDADAGVLGGHAVGDAVALQLQVLGDRVVEAGADQALGHLHVVGAGLASLVACSRARSIGASRERPR
jgi:hypothetical protein